MGDRPFRRVGVALTQIAVRGGRDEDPAAMWQTSGEERTWRNAPSRRTVVRQIFMR